MKQNEKKFQQCPDCGHVFESNPTTLKKTVFTVAVWERPGSTDVGQVEEAFVSNYLEENYGETVESVDVDYE